MHRLSFLLSLMLTFTLCSSQTYPLHYIRTGTDAFFRGLSVANSNAIWVSGSKGWVGRSADGGKNWTFHQVYGYEHCDFRTVHAFDAANAVIANAGSPAYILRTVNGGDTWTKVYENTDTAAFIDGVSFWNGRQGLIHGDPIGGRMLLLYTDDGGRSWKQRTGPRMNPGEASFAASGTAIHCFRNSTVVVASGGKTARLFLSRNKGRRWRAIPTPMLAGMESTGIFSFMTGRSDWHWLIAGGDYRRDTLRTANFYYSRHKGRKWLAPVTSTRGYRECLAQIDDQRPAKKSRTRTMFALGRTGLDISVDDGRNWTPLFDEEGFHVIKPASDHSKLFLAGSLGRLAILDASQR